VTAPLPFLGLCQLITVTPGPDAAVVVRGAERGGRAVPIVLGGRSLWSVWRTLGVRVATE
jgi:hypothetical protein